MRELERQHRRIDVIGKNMRERIRGQRRHKQRPGYRKCGQLPARILGLRKNMVLFLSLGGSHTVGLRVAASDVGIDTR